MDWNFFLDFHQWEKRKNKEPFKERERSCPDFSKFWGSLFNHAASVKRWDWFQIKKKSKKPREKKSTLFSENFFNKNLFSKKNHKKISTKIFLSQISSLKSFFLSFHHAQSSNEEYIRTFTKRQKMSSPKSVLGLSRLILAILGFWDLFYSKQLVIN